MKKFILLLLLAGCCWQFIACNSASPREYFDIAILSCNTMHGFAEPTQERGELESPSVQMIDGNKDNFAPMKRKEIIDNKIQTLEAYQEKLKNLNETDDTRDILKASAALYDYVLPVYKNEYRELARLYDENASKENINSYTQSISDKYFPAFEQLFQKLIVAGKAFAEKHAINVTWDIQTSPR